MTSSPENKITRSDLVKSAVNTGALGMEFSWTYYKQMNIAFCLMVANMLKKIYAGRPDDYAAALHRHCAFFNITVQFAPFVGGIAMAMEEKVARGEIEPESVNDVKAALMGPLSGIGDSIFLSTLRVVAAAVGISLCQAGNPFGPIAFLLIYNVPGFALRIWGAVKGYELAVNPGEFVAITGPSGSGKSTLMNILGCLDKPTAGGYYLQGLNVAELDDDELTEVRALSIGFVFQSFNLLPRLSVIENVMLPLAYTNVPRSQREMRAVHALQAVTLPVDHWDHRISELSGGQMQRVAIARALVNDPPIILADEPTGNLDSATGALVMETFHKLQKRGKTIVLITHDPGIAAEADRAVTIRDGRIHDGAYIPHAPRTLRSAVDSLPRISASANPPKGEMA